MALFLDFILTADITITFILLFLVFKQKNKQLPQLILSIYFTILLLISVNLYAAIHKLRIIFFISYIPHDIARWILGPLLFLYIKSLFLKKEKLIRSSILHFIPAALHFIFISIPSLLSDINGQPFPGYLKTYQSYSSEVANLSNAYTLFYLLISYKLLSGYIKGIKSNYANLGKNDINWISHLLISGSIVIGFDLIMNGYQSIFGTFVMHSEIFTLIAMILFITYLGYYGIHQSKILLPGFLLKKSHLTSSKEEKRTALSTTNDPLFSELKLKLEEVLKKEKPYLDNELTLIKLAEFIPTTDKKLSALLNQHMHISFYDIINKYRVEAVKEKIASKAYENYTLLGIGYECGFSSKASFNRIFKKETGLSPSEYKKLH
ncbi:helix-turn-helix domain-containing protein [Flavobacteriaceae bacterium R38]|nr:helix-turn-helix domain-containing protein [Flavobacteriaceae bacterium R38]